jgi:hypothetical protein
VIAAQGRSVGEQEPKDGRTATDGKNSKPFMTRTIGKKVQPVISDACKLVAD